MAKYNEFENNFSSSDNRFEISVDKAKEQLTRIVTTYTEKNPDGSYIIPFNKQRPIMLSKYFSGDKETKDIVEEFLTKKQFSYRHCAYSFYMSLVFMTENINIIKHFKYYTDRANDHIFLYIIEKNTKMIKLLLKAGYTFDTDRILKIAVFYPEIYKEYLAENFFKELPIIFKKNNKELRNIPELIPFLFKSERYHTYLQKKDVVSLDTLGIMIHLRELLNSEGFESIKNYCPTISLIHCTTICSILNENNDLIEDIKTKIDDNIIIYGSNSLLDFAIYAAKNIKKIFADKSISITYEFLRNFYFPSDIISILELFKGNIVLLPTETDDYYCRIVSLNHKQLTEKAVEYGIINSSCYEDAIEYAVERNAYNVLDVLRTNYNQIFPEDTISWGTFIPDPDD